MELTEVLKQPDGFTPPSVTVTIEKVYAYKSGDSENGPWSFQDVKTNGGVIKLKNLLREFPVSRAGQTVTIRANQSKTHGLTGLKVLHEQYQGKTFDKLIVTDSAKWEWSAAATNGNGSAPASSPTAQSGAIDDVRYTDHLLSCAELAAVIGAHLSLDEPQALQACFATICIDTKNRNILLPKPKTLTPPPTGLHDSGPEDEPTATTGDPFSEDDGIPF